MIIAVFAIIFAATALFAILHVFDKDELVWSLLASLGWVCLAGLSWNIEYVFGYESAGVVAFEVYEYSGGVFLMWFFFAIAVVFAILSYQRAMSINRKAVLGKGRTPGGYE
jgi:hypothetical protein